METKRLDYLDMAKGIGIILVVIGHSGMAAEGIITWLSSFHMPLFLLVSGMLMYHKKEEERPFSGSLKKKARSILIPYAFFSVIYLLVQVYYMTRGREVQLVDAVLQTVSFSGISVLWFLPALFIGEVIFLAIRKNTSLPVTAVCCGGLALALILAKRLYEVSDIFAGGLFFLWLGYLVAALIRGGIAAVFLAMGYYVMVFKKIAVEAAEKKGFSRGLSRKWYFLAAVLLFLANLGVEYRNGIVDLRYMIFGNPVLYFGGAFLGSMAVVCLCRALPRIRLLAWLGINSLIIMVTHLDCFVMYFAHKYAYFMNRFIPFGKEYVLRLNVALALFLMEAVIIYAVNRFFPFLVGKSFQPARSDKSA